MPFTVTERSETSSKDPSFVNIGNTFNKNSSVLFNENEEKEVEQ